MADFTSLPRELILLIVEHLNRSSIQNLSLVSKLNFELLRPLLYQHPVIIDRQKRNCLKRTIEERPELALLVQKINLYYGAEAEFEQDDLIEDEPSILALLPNLSQFEISSSEWQSTEWERQVGLCLERPQPESPRFGRLRNAMIDYCDFFPSMPACKSAGHYALLKVPSLKVFVLKNSVTDYRADFQVDFELDHLGFIDCTLRIECFGSVINARKTKSLQICNSLFSSNNHDRNASINAFVAKVSSSRTAQSLVTFRFEQKHNDYRWQCYLSFKNLIKLEHLVLRLKDLEELHGSTVGHFQNYSLTDLLPRSLRSISTQYETSAINEAYFSTTWEILREILLHKRWFQNFKQVTYHDWHPVYGSLDKIMAEAGLAQLANQAGVKLNTVATPILYQDCSQFYFD